MKQLFKAFRKSTQQPIGTYAYTSVGNFGDFRFNLNDYFRLTTLIPSLAGAYEPQGNENVIVTPNTLKAFCQINDAIETLNLQQA